MVTYRHIMANYELLYTLPAKYTEGEITALREKIGGELSALGISISRNAEIGKIRLAYPMQHVRYGHYVLVNFAAESPVLAKVNEQLRLHPDVLRHQVVRAEAGAKPFVSLADPDARIERREPVAVAALKVPLMEPVSTGPAITQEELDKKLSAIEEDITKAL